MEQAEKDLRAIIEACANAKDNPPGSEKQKIGDMYASYMDEARAEQLGIEPIAGMLAAIDRIENKADLLRIVRRVGPRSACPARWAAASAPMQRNRTSNILYLSQGGLGLPDRDYYWDPKYEEKAGGLSAHVERMLSLAKVPDAKQAAADIVAFETRLAKAQWSKAGNPRQHEDLQQQDPRRTRQARSRLRLGPLLQRRSASKADRRPSSQQPSYFTAMAACWTLCRWRPGRRG